MKWTHNAARIAALAALAVGIPAAGANAQPVETCSASPLLALGLHPGRANGGASPCINDEQKLAKFSQGAPNPLLGPLFPTTVKAAVLVGATGTDPDPDVPSAEASAEVADASFVVPGLSVQATAVHTTAKAVEQDGCGAIGLSGKSRIATLIVNGQHYNVIEREFSIPILGLGKVYVNQRLEYGGQIIRRAVFVDLPGTALDAVIAESRAGISCGELD